MERKAFEDKVRACWFGKCLAGAIGMPYEGVPFTLELQEKEIRLANVPNDDLELQLVWLEALDKYGLTMTCRELGEIWQKRIQHGCDEYSIALYNMKHGIMPPFSGMKNNWFADGMGAAIRSEIWALIFAGRPDAAAYFARQDAEVDHWGDGVRGECFMAMAEAHVCENSDIYAALRYALEHTDSSSRLYRAISEVFQMYDDGVSDEAAKTQILVKYQAHPNFTDCVTNLVFIVNSLLRGSGDFMKTVLDTVNFGRDTDCTAATVGAFLGAAAGMKVFPEKYLSAVADKMELGDFVTSIPGVPLTITELTARTIELHDRFAAVLPAEKYPEYVPCGEDESLPECYSAGWLILNDDEADINAVKAAVAATGKVPAPYKDRIVTFNTPYLDLSRYSGHCRLHLLTFLQVNNPEQNPDEVVFMATADVGIRVWLDDKRILNNHSRHKMLPAFHRVQGGAAFLLPLRYGEKHLLHVELFHGREELQACVMIGNTCNDILDGYDLAID